jgi:hypothetical protein
MLRPTDRENLEIRRFIFHPILKDSEDHYFDEIVLNDDQRVFFTNWLAGALTQATEFEFVDRDANDGLLSAATEIRDGSHDDFIECSKRVTALFKRFHKGSTSDGILAIALGNAPSGNLLFFVKTTFEEVLSYQEDEINGRRRVTLLDIPNPISEDRNAIQKVAIVNVDADYDWEVLAQDRQNGIPYKIADFFKSFLNVREREVASVLTRKVFGAVQQWAKANREILDPDQKHSEYYGRAYEYLATHNEFETDQFIATVVVDHNEDRRQELRTSLRQTLENQELAGRVFPPMPSSIPKGDAKTTWKTRSGVVISFLGTSVSNHISITQENNEQVITIRTTELIAN